MIFLNGAWFCIRIRHSFRTIPHTVLNGVSLRVIAGAVTRIWRVTGEAE